MARKKIVLEFVFEEKIYEDEDWTDLALLKINLGKGTTLTESERGRIAEQAGQSDFWQVDVHNDIFNVIDTGVSVKYSD